MKFTSFLLNGWVACVYIERSISILEECYSQCLCFGNFLIRKTKEWKSILDSTAMRWLNESKNKKSGMYKLELHVCSVIWWMCSLLVVWSVYSSRNVSQIILFDTKQNGAESNTKPLLFSKRRAQLVKSFGFNPRSMYFSALTSLK